MKAITIEQEGAAPAVADLLAATAEANEVLVPASVARRLTPWTERSPPGCSLGWSMHEYPVTLGRDFAGTVEALGDGVTSVAAGDEVFGVVPAAHPRQARDPRALIALKKGEEHGSLPDR